MMLVRDDFTMKSWIYFLARKSDAYLGLKDFLLDVTADGKVRIVRTDNGGELKGRLAEVCKEYSIRQEFTPSNRLQ